MSEYLIKTNCLLRATTNGVDTVHVMLEELHDNYYLQWFLDGGRIIDQH